MDVRTLCLGVLSLGDASGYEIKKALEGPFRHFYDASFGSIYPALNRLQANGYVECNHETQSKRPDKKVYTLTMDGKLAFVEELNVSPAADRIRSEFMVAMLFSELLPTRRVSEIIDERIAHYREMIAQCHQEVGQHQKPGERFVTGFGLAMFTTALQYIEDNRHLVESGALLAQVHKDRSYGAETQSSIQAAD